MGWWSSIAERRKWLHWAILIAAVCHVFAPHCVEHGYQGQLSSICQSGVDTQALATNAAFDYFEEIAVKDLQLPDHGCDCAQSASISMPLHQPSVPALLVADGRTVAPTGPPEHLVVRLEDVRPMQNAPPQRLS